MGTASCSHALWELEKMKRGAKSINTFLKQVQDSAAGFPRKSSKTTSGKFVQKGIYQNGGNDVSKYEGWAKENTKFNRVMCILMAALNCPQTISRAFHGWRKELITLRELDYFKRPLWFGSRTQTAASGLHAKFHWSFTCVPTALITLSGSGSCKL